MGRNAHDRIFGARNVKAEDNRPAVVIERKARATLALVKLGVEITTVETLARTGVR